MEVKEKKWHTYLLSRVFDLVKADVVVERDIVAKRRSEKENPRERKRPFQLRIQEGRRREGRYSSDWIN